jgi:hypothetical protein
VKIERRPQIRKIGLIYGLCLLGSGLCVSAAASADSIYNVSIDTSSLMGTSSTLAFDFIDGGPPSNSVSISNFVTDGALASPSTSGSVSGTVANTVTLSDTSFFNELQQPIKLGSILSFQLSASSNAPVDSSLPDTFSFFILDPTATSSLLTTTDPTGAASLFTLQIDGTSGGALGIYDATPLVPVSATLEPVPLPASVQLLLSGIVAIGAFYARKLRFAPSVMTS